MHTYFCNAKKSKAAVKSKTAITHSCGKCIALNSVFIVVKCTRYEAHKRVHKTSGQLLDEYFGELELCAFSDVLYYVNILPYDVMYFDKSEKEPVLRGTIKPDTHFCVEDEARALRLSAKENPDTNVITDILARSVNEKRQQIKCHYKQAYGRDLDEDFKKCLSGNFEILVRALLMKPSELDAYCLHKAMIGLGTTESVLIEILVTRSNSDIIEIKKAYKEKYGNELEEDIKSDTSGDFRHLLVALANGKRKEDTEVDLTKAVKDAELLVRAGISKYGTDEETFASIMASQSFTQLKAVFHAFEKLANKDIRSVIKTEFAGDAGECLMAIVDVVRDRNAYFASRLQSALKGLARNDIRISRIVVSRSEIDLFNIKRAFFQLTNKALVDVLEAQISSDAKFKKLLLAIIG